MKRLYSPSIGCTYVEGIHEEFPADVVDITDKLYKEVIANPPRNKVRMHDEKGLPYLVDAPVLAPDPVAQEREWRDAALASVMWLRERHRDQVEISEQTTLTAEQFAALLVYMQALRDWPQSPDFPNSDHRPQAPAWIADQTE